MADIAKQVGPKLWIVDGDPVRMYRIPFETRMTIAQLADGGLWMHSPVALSEARLDFIKQLGPLQHIIAPTGMHNLYVKVWHEHFPDATRWIEPGVHKRVPDLAFDHFLDGETKVPWQDEIEHVYVNGSSILNELVFFHKPSQSVIFTDIIQNHDPQKNNWFWRIMKRWIGVLAPTQTSPRDWRLTIQNKDAIRAAVTKILEWDFQRVIVNHGICVEEDAKAFVTQAFRWIM